MSEAQNITNDFAQHILEVLIHFSDACVHVTCSLCFLRPSRPYLPNIYFFISLFHFIFHFLFCFFFHLLLFSCFLVQRVVQFHFVTEMMTMGTGCSSLPPSLVEGDRVKTSLRRSPFVGREGRGSRWHRYRRRTCCGLRTSSLDC